jgi:hypothetical protein
VVELGGRRIGIEAKFSAAPRVSRGFWLALEDLGIDRAWVVAPVVEGWPLAANVEVVRPAALRTALAGPA